MSKDYEIYNDYHEWIKRGEKVNKQAYEKLMQYQSFEEKLLEKIYENTLQNRNTSLGVVEIRSSFRGNL